MYLHGHHAGPGTDAGILDLLADDLRKDLLNLPVDTGIFNTIFSHSNSLLSETGA